MKQKTRIWIYILVAVAVVIMGTLTILKNNQTEKPTSAQEHLDLGRIYLNDLSYDKAVLEFKEAINIEPLNADAYLGLAEAYEGAGDTEKAIEILEEGYDKTGDDRLKDMLEKLLPPVPEETTAVTTTAVITATEETTTTVAMVVVPDLSGLTEEEAIAACESAGLQYNVSYDYSNEIEKGYVIRQAIPVNASVAEGISVPFTVSNGGKIVTEAAIETTIPATEKIDCKVKIFDNQSEYFNGKNGYPEKEITYDSNGQVVKIEEYFNPSFSDGPYRCVIEYDENNNIYKRRVIDKNENELLIGFGDSYFNINYENMYYNGKIAMSKMTEPNPVYSINYYKIYIYNKLNQCTDEVVIDGSYGEDYTLNDYMTLVNSLTSSFSGYQDIRMWKHYEYDSTGNIIREFGFNEDYTNYYDGIITSWTNILHPTFREYYNYKDERSWELEVIREESYEYLDGLSSIRVFEYGTNKIYNLTYGKNFVMISDKKKQNNISYSLNGLDKKYINSINYLVDYTYNTNNQLIKEEKNDFNIFTGFYLKETIEYQYDSNGDLIKKKDTSYGSVYEHTYSYEYVKK